MNRKELLEAPRLLTIMPNAFMFDSIIKDIFKNRQPDGTFKETETHGMRINCTVIPIGETDWSNFSNNACNYCYSKGYTNIFYNINKHNLSWTTGVTRNGEPYIITPELYEALRKGVGKPITDKKGQPTGATIEDTCKIRVCCSCVEKRVIKLNPHWYLNNHRTECYEILYEALPEEQKPVEKVQVNSEIKDAVFEEISSEVTDAQKEIIEDPKPVTEE